MPTTISRMQDERLAGALAVLVALVGMAVANFSAGDGENGGAPEFAVTAVILVVVSALVFGRLLPRTGSPGRLAAGLALTAVATSVVFWSGLPVLLGVAAAVAGARASTTGGWIAAAAGLMAAAGGLVALLVG